MSPWYDGLTDTQRQIAEDPRTPLHVLAGPGTGKTLAMMRRVARLLEEGVLPDDILAISFTRTAAMDLKEQLNKLGVAGADRVCASTLHSFCFSILNTKAVFGRTQRVPRPLLSYEKRCLELDLKNRFGGLKAVRKLLSAYEAAWARLQTDVPGGPSNEVDEEFHVAAIDWLSYHRTVLIGELIPLTFNFMQQNPVADVIPRFGHVLVDEYQDLNRAEQELIDLLSSFGTLTVMGDDCQSIYSFKYANPEGIRSFGVTRPGTVLYTIEECRRCPPNIVDMSNALIAYEPSRTRDVPLSANRAREDAKVTVVQHYTLDDEVETLSDYIAHYLQQNPGLPEGQVLVLTQRRFIGNAIRDALIERGLDAISCFSENPVQASSAAEGFALLTLLVNPNDRASLRAWLGMSRSSGLVGGYSRLREAAGTAGTEPCEILERIAKGDLSVPHTQLLVERWNALLERLTELKGLEGLDLVRALWPVEDADSDDIRLIAEEIAVQSPEPAIIVEELRQAITQPHLPKSDSNIIRVMSLHKSKGLTASLVVIAGAMAGVLPFVKDGLSPAEQDAQVQEQRRLFYVALTRAKDALVISAPAQILFSEAKRANVKVSQRRCEDGELFAMFAMSPFVGELGSTCPATIPGGIWRAREEF
jgi:DNA helicase-2/ATP-dependent DNA helicase PcrA